VGNGILPAQAAPLAAVGPPPHLQAFGVPSQVSSASNIHTVVNHFGGSGPASFSFFDGLSSGLAPPIAGQEGSTLEQFLGRSLKNWKPFTSDADFKEALTDWLDRITQQLADGGDNSAALRAVVSYIMTTLGYVSEHGHQLVFKYHKAVMQAMRKSPPLYDPLINGAYLHTGLRGAPVQFRLERRGQTLITVFFTAWWPQTVQPLSRRSVCQAQGCRSVVCRPSWCQPHQRRVQSSTEQQAPCLWHASSGRIWRLTIGPPRHREWYGSSAERCITSDVSPVLLYSFRPGSDAQLATNAVHIVARVFARGCKHSSGISRSSSLCVDS
jgi:hypothetical protein